MAKNREEYDKKYEEKRAGQRTRNWLVIFYPEDLPDDWKEKADELGVRWIEGPVHDKDVNPDGTPKKTHIHTLWMFDAVKHKGQVTGLLRMKFAPESEAEDSIPGVATPMPCSDRSQSVRYMAHLDHPSKAQYDIAEIVGHNGADPAEVMRYSATETINMMVAMEEYIEEHGITELADFSKAIRYENPEWYTILATKMTTYFNAFIRSRRHKLEKGEEPKKQRFSAAPPVGEPPLLVDESTGMVVDPKTGEILAGDDDDDGYGGLTLGGLLYPVEEGDVK